MVPTRISERLLLNVEPDGDCIVSRYSTGSHGYSQIGWKDDGRNRMALGHRIAWEALRGPIPSSLTVDHICHNRRCVNVDHLRLLSNVDNARDNGHVSKTECPRGHEYDETNTYRNPKGHRICRACARERRLV